MGETQFEKDFDLDLDERRSKPVETDTLDRSAWRIVTDMSPAEYHADPAPEPSLSNSLMKYLLDETPLDFAFQHPRLNPDAEKLKETIASVMGDVVHRLALGKGKDYVILPSEFQDFRKDAAKAIRDDAAKAGKVAILAHKFEEAEATAAVMRERIEQVLDGAAYETEVVFLYQEMTSAGPIWCRGQVDVWSEEAATVIDLKASPQLYDPMIARQMVNMGWDRQLAYYPHALGTIIPELAGRIKAADLLVKPEAPFTARLAAPEKAWLASSLRFAQRAMEIFGQCLHAGKWPGFGKKVDLIPMPRWEEMRREAIELGGE